MSGIRASLAIVFACTLLLGESVHAQSHPSGISQRVLIAVQNPTGAQSGSSIIVPQFSMQIADAANDDFPSATPPLISGCFVSGYTKVGFALVA